MGCAALASHGRAIEPHNNERRQRTRTIIETTLTRKARMNAYKDGIAERERVREKRRARVERGAGDVRVEPGNEEQMADRQTVASGEEEKQHEENRMIDVHFGKRGSETTSKEQLDKKGRQYDSNKKLQIHLRAQTRMCLWNILRVVRHKVGRGPYLYRSLVMLTMTKQILRWMYSTRCMDERVVT